jgi:hypothetical protein
MPAGASKPTIVPYLEHVPPDGIRERALLVDAEAVLSPLSRAATPVLDAGSAGGG